MSMPLNSPVSPLGERDQESKICPQKSLRKLIFILGVSFGLVVALHFTPLAGYVREAREWLETIDERSLRAEVIFASFAAVLITIGTPRLIFFGLAGFLFGFAEGLLTAMAATMVGSLIAFHVIRWGCRDWVVGKFGKRRFFRRISHARTTVASVFLIRQLPISNLFINACLALSQLKTSTYMIGSFFGFLPQGMAAVLIGGGVADDVAWQGLAQLATAAIVLAGISYLGWSRIASRQKITTFE